MTAEAILNELFAISDTAKREGLSRFFKTGKGQYGEGDIFIGIMVPQLRAIVKKYKSLSLHEIEILMQSPYHEARMTGLFFLVELFKKNKTEQEKKVCMNFIFNRPIISTIGI